MAHTDRHWIMPDGEERDEQLQLYNSQVDDKVPFIPQGGKASKAITWYTCGPTVYDASHIGHARNYVTFDIIRRVLEDYFGYNITFVMNITDVDDKIIFRARRNHLWDTFTQQQRSTDDLLSMASAAIEEAIAKQEGKVAKSEAAAAAAAERNDTRKAKDLAEQHKGEELKLVKLLESKQSVAALRTDGHGLSPSRIEAVVKDPISEKLDAEQGAEVTDKEIYRAHAAKYENMFLEDMRALGVRDPDIMPRVSDYVDHIIKFIQTIEDKGMAYEAAGSVYFNVRAFQASGHKYGKLKPWAVGSAELASESESNFSTDAKRSPQDFALWKASKPGEPTWESPWGQGRPGWHIECSAMADAVLGNIVDIHSGGEDLKFPHHDNEIAQSLAYLHDPQSNNGCCACKLQWVNYWLHSGHLAIDGLKMSKSLKNFITIREALDEFSPRQIRLLFCLQAWHKPMTFNQASREEMITKEATLKNFFQNVQVKLRENPIADTSTNSDESDTKLTQKITACQQEVHQALLDNINTAKAMAAILDLVAAVNRYLSEKEASSSRPAPLLLCKATRFVSRILTVFGLEQSADKMAFVGEVSGGEDSAPAVLDAFTNFRDQVREFARSDTGKCLSSHVLNLLMRHNDIMTQRRYPPKDWLSMQLMEMCDVLRDSTMVDLGIRLEDKPSGGIWKRDDPETLKREVLDKRRAAAEAARKKVQTNLELKRSERDRVLVVTQTSLSEKLADRYKLSEDEQPTHAKQPDGSWKELDEKGKKNAVKAVEKEKKARAPLLKKVAENPQFIEQLEEAIVSLAAEFESLSADTSDEQ